MNHKLDEKYSDAVLRCGNKANLQLKQGDFLNADPTRANGILVAFLRLECLALMRKGQG